jgi:hypothetical protein
MNLNDQPPLVEPEQDESVHGEMDFDPACDAQTNAMDATKLNDAKSMDPNHREMFDYKNVHMERNGY